jgi:hypothetical protein
MDSCELSQGGWISCTLVRRGGAGPKATQAMALGVAQKTSYTHAYFLAQFAI